MAIAIAPLQGGAAINSLQAAIDACDNVGGPGGARGDCTIELGTGVITSDGTLRIGAPGIRYEGPIDKSLLDVGNVRGSRISSVCLDGGDLINNGATLRCEAISANCGEMISRTSS